MKQDIKVNISGVKHEDCIEDEQTKKKMTARMKVNDTLKTTESC
jgi:hypothetical protein